MPSDIRGATDNLERALDEFIEAARESEDQVAQPGRTDTEALIEELNKLYTPILVANEISARVAETSDTPRSGSVIKFDPETRKAQLISVCARLIAKYKNCPDYQVYLRATKAAQAAKLKIQKDHHAAAIAIADDYLARLAATSNDPDTGHAAQTLAAVKVT